MSSTVISVENLSKFYRLGMTKAKIDRKFEEIVDFCSKSVGVRA